MLEFLRNYFQISTVPSYPISWRTNGFRLKIHKFEGVAEHNKTKDCWLIISGNDDVGSLAEFEKAIERNPRQKPFHARRLQTLKALTYVPSSSTDILSKLYEIMFDILIKSVYDAYI